MWQFLLTDFIPASSLSQVFYTTIIFKSSFQISFGFSSWRQTFFRHDLLFIGKKRLLESLQKQSFSDFRKFSKIFESFTEKHLWWSLFSIKLLVTPAIYEKQAPTQEYFPVKFAKTFFLWNLRKHFLQNTFGDRFKNLASLS